MSRTIDERIVEMRFDNRQFEQNVQTSLSTLDKLKRGLDLDNAAKSLDGLGDAAKRCDMSVLGKSVETVQAKFSAFQVVAMTTLSNITNSAVNTGKRLVSALTIDPIKTGFQEYETQIGAVQTILANTQHEGTNLQQVNRALDELNTYADKTIYNFTEMTRNIGTFTAAGVNLRTSVDSIKGIANLAAISGSTSQQASTAMYQLSQALAAGKVSLMDWNSVVNAGMGGKVFQDALVRTSELLGTGAQNAINMYGSFRESLTRGEWLTTEVLTETLKQFAGAYSEADLIQQGFSEAQARDIAQMAKTAEDAATKVKTFTQLWDTLKESAQSGWTTTWEILVGDFEEAKEVLTEVSDAIGGVISETSQARNELLSGGLSSGWKQLLDQGIADEGGFIESIQEVARESGDAFDKLVADSESFSDALKQGLTDGVVSSETLTQAVHNLREKMTGMSQEERKAAGYTAEMIEQIEALDKGLQNGSVSMEEFTEKILRPSGRENLIQAVWNAAKGLVSVITPIKDAFREIFPPATADQLYSLTETLRSFSERLTLSEETADKLGRTFKGLFSVLDLVRQGALAIFNALAPLGSGAGSLADGILTITAGIGDFLVGINEAAKQGEFFGMVAQTVASALEFVVSGIERLTGFLADAFAAPGLESFQALLGRIQTRIGQVVDAVSGLGGGVSDAADTMDSALENSKFLQMLQTIFNGAKTLVSGIIGVFGGLAGALVENLSNANFSGVIDLLNGVSLGAIALGIKKFLDSFREVTDSVGSIKEGVIGILDGVKGCFQAWQNDVNAKALLKIAAAVAVLSASILTISLIDSEKLTASLGAITVLFTELMAAMAVFGKLDLNVRGTMKRSTAMIALSSSVLILASALKSVATLEPEQMAAGLAGIAGLMAALVAAAKVLGSGSSSIIKGSAQMVVFAAAIKILASACADLAQLDLAGLAKGLTGVGVLLAEVSLFMNAAKFSGRSVVTASGVLVLAGAMKVLASACKDFAQMGVGELVKGLSAIGAVLLEITAFTKLAGSAKGLIATGAAMIEIGAAMKIFASAMADFGRMSLAEIGKGLLAMGGALAEVAVAMRFMPRNMVTMGAGLIAVGAALNIIADAMRSMGGMSWESVAKSLVTMGGALAELAVGLNFMNGTLSGSAAMLVAAAALAVLTPVLVTLGSMSWEAIAKGLVTVAGAFAVIGTAGALLTPLLPTILGLGGAFALIGVGVAGVGAGLLLVGTGLSAIAVGVTALATSLGAGVAIIVAGLTSIITGIAALIPAIAEKLGEAVVAFAQVITNGAPAIGEAVKTLVLTMVDVLVECVPAIAEGALELVAGVLDALVAYTPQIVDSVMQFLIAVIDGLARNMPTLIQSVVDLLMSFFSGIVSALGSIDTDALLKGIAGIGLLSGIMVALGALAGLIPSAMVGVLGLGVVIAELAIVLAAVGALAQIPGLEWLISEGGQLLQTIGNAIGGFIGGIVGGFMSGVSGSFPQIGMDLAAFMTNIQPFIDGARGIDPAMLEGVKALTGAIMLITAADLLEGLTSWLTGGSSLSTFAEELVPFGEAMKKFSHSITGLDGDLVSTAAIAGKTLAEMAATLPNSGGIAGFFAGENDMGTFGDQLVGFGGSMMKFAASIKGLDTDAVQNAAIAGKAMAELAATLPNTGGAVGFFAGNNDMDDFGEQLVPFGAAIKAYSDAVKGLDVEAVTNSAIAGQAMSELAATLPNTGGAVAFFAGDNDLATFGEQLVSFGASIKSYAQEVTGLDTDAVASSTVAGQTLVELAKALPNTGGLLSFFTGGTDLASFGDDLTLFGADLSAYAEAISNVKADVVTASANAAEALSNLASGLPDSSLFDKWFGGDQTLASFGGDISKFGAAMKDYYGQISGIDTGRMADVVAQVWSLLELAEGAAGVNTSGLTGFADSMRKMGDAGISGFTSAFYNCGDTVNKAVSSMLSTVSGAVLSNLPVTNGAMETVVQSLANIVDGKVPAIRTSTSDMMRTMGASITAHSRTVGDAMRTVLFTAVSNINRMKPEFETAGKNAGQGFINGINSKLGGARSAGRSLGLAALEAAKKALDSHSPSREFIHLGENVGEGLAIGVNNSIVPAAQAASGMIDEVIAVSEKGVDAFEDWINEKQYYGELSLMDELAGWENLQKKYRAGSEERMKIDREVYRVQNELVSATYQASLDWIEEEKYYKRLSTEEELAAYERMQARYLEGSKERMELDRKVFTLRNQLVDESYQNSMDWIEEEKYYNRLSLADELAAYKRVQSRYAKGTEERKKLDREVYRLEQEIYEAQQQYIADVQSVQESANQRRIQLEEAYANKVKSINEQLERDIESLNQQYQDAVESRTKSLYQSYGLFDEVAKKEAVSSETLMQNLEGQVQEFGEWQDILGQLSARGVDSDLIAELQEMGPSAIEEIRALNSMSDDELEKYVSLWSIKHAQARDQATSELEGLRVETQEQIAQLRADAAVELEEYRLTWQSEMAQLEEDTSRQLASLRQEFSENVGLIKRDTEAKMAEMTEAARKILSEAGWTETGQQIPAGLAQGVAQSKSTFIDELTSMALAGVEAVKNTLEINSPSRVFRELGSFTGLGFVSGLAGYAERSFAAGADMADSAVDGLSGAIAGLPDLLSGEAEMRPTIRPVLDLSDLTGASTQIDSLFYPLRSIRLAGQASLAFQNASGENRMTVKVDNDDIIEELRTLRSEMAEMTERMERMRVVLDTGTLVGEMAGPMDNALGQRATRRGRGN